MSAMRILASVGGAGTWRVITRPIPATEWTEILDRKTGRIYAVPGASR